MDKSAIFETSFERTRAARKLQVWMPNAIISEKEEGDIHTKLDNYNNDLAFVHDLKQCKDLAERVGNDLRAKKVQVSFMGKSMTFRRQAV